MMAVSCAGNYFNGQTQRNYFRKSQKIQQNMGYGPWKRYGLWDNRILWVLIENQGGGHPKCMG
jgi:hypothetical protein